MSTDLNELIKLLDNFKKEIKADIEDIIKREINKSNLSLSSKLEEYGNKCKDLEKENLELKTVVAKQQRTIESIRRQNNIIFFGINEFSGENFDSLENSILDLCNKVLSVQVTKTDLNYVRRIGKTGDRPRPVVVSLISKIKKREMFQNAAKLKGSKIYIGEDLDKDSQAERKELLKTQSQIRESGQSCLMRRNGLMIEGKFYHSSALVRTDGQSFTTRKGGVAVEEDEEEAETSTEAASIKKRKRIKKRLVGTAQTEDIFRPRSDSASSAKSHKI